HQMIEAYPKLNWGFSAYDIFKDDRLRSRVSTKVDDDILNNVFDSLLKGIAIQTSSVVVRKQFLVDSNIWFSQGVSNSEDREVWYKLSCCDKRPFYIQVPLAKYILHTKQKSLTKSIGREFHFLTMEKRLENYLKRTQEG